MLLHCHSIGFLCKALKYQEKKYLKRWWGDQKSCFLFLQMFPFQRVGDSIQEKLPGIIYRKQDFEVGTT